MVEDCSNGDLLSDIYAHLMVLCPDHEATRHLAHFIEQHLVAAGVLAITLRLPSKVFATRRTPLERRVYATLSALRSASDPHQTYSVDLAHTSGSSPFCSGALAIRTSLADDSVSFVLAGRYEPPAGVGDVRFDIAIARRIAQASASDLLRAMATYVELASARNAAAHAGKHAFKSRAADHERDASVAATLPE